MATFPCRAPGKAAPSMGTYIMPCNPIHELIRLLTVGDEITGIYESSVAALQEAHDQNHTAQMFHREEPVSNRELERLERQIRKAEKRHDGFRQSVKRHELRGIRAINALVARACEWLQVRSYKCTEAEQATLEEAAVLIGQMANSSGNKRTAPGFEMDCLLTNAPLSVLERLHMLAGKCGSVWCGDLKQCICGTAHRQLHYLSGKLAELQWCAGRMAKHPMEWPRFFDTAMTFLWQCDNEACFPDVNDPFWLGLAVNVAREVRRPCLSFASATHCVMLLKRDVYHLLVNTLGEVHNKVKAVAPSGFSPHSMCGGGLFHAVAEAEPLTTERRQNWASCIQVYDTLHDSVSLCKVDREKLRADLARILDGFRASDVQAFLLIEMSAVGLEAKIELTAGRFDEAVSNAMLDAAYEQSSKSHEGGSKRVKKRSTDLENSAIALLLNPEYGPNVAKIAKKLDVPRTTLNGWPLFKDALRRRREASERERSRWQRGYKNKDGQVDGISDDNE